MTIYEHLEKWRDGTYRYVEKWEKGSKDVNGKSRGGQYKKYEDMENKKIANRQNVGIWNNKPQQKIVPEINHKDYVKGDYYRASISLNVPLNGTKHKPNYVNFTYVVIDKLENINMQEMYNEFIENIEGMDGLHYNKKDWWFDSAFSDCDRQNPKPYSAKHPDKIFEGTNK